MNYKKVNLSGIYVIDPDVYKDERGYFFESFNDKKYDFLGKEMK